MTAPPRSHITLFPGRTSKPEPAPVTMWGESPIVVQRPALDYLDEARARTAARMIAGGRIPGPLYLAALGRVARHSTRPEWATRAMDTLWERWGMRRG